MPAAFQRLPLFLVGSGIGAVIDYALTLVMHSWLSVSAPVGLALAMLVSATVVFFFHHPVTFAMPEGRIGGRYLAFLGWSFLVYLMRAGLLFVFDKWGVILPVALFLAIGLASAINYLVSQATIFRHRPPPA